MSLLFLGLRSRPLMSIPKSGISQSSLNKLGLLSLPCIIIWIIAFSAIGCNWRSQETSISGIYGIWLWPPNLMWKITMKTTSNLSYFGLSMVTPHFWNQKNQPSHWISLHKEMTFGFRNSTFFQVQDASHRNHCGCSPAIWFRSFHLPDSLDPLGHSPEYHKGRSRKSSDREESLTDLTESAISECSELGISEIPNTRISDTQRIFKEPKLATSLIKALHLKYSLQAQPRVAWSKPSTTICWL
jgi:hypothetical protein